MSDDENVIVLVICAVDVMVDVTMLVEVEAKTPPTSNEALLLAIELESDVESVLRDLEELLLDELLDESLVDEDTRSEDDI